MSVHSVTAGGPVVPPTAASRAPAARPAERATPPVSLIELDKVTHQPIPPRFPWLSRLTSQLQPVSKQPAPYGNTPPLGEKLDQRA